MDLSFLCDQLYTRIGFVGRLYFLGGPIFTYLLTKILQLLGTFCFLGVDLKKLTMNLEKITKIWGR
jgi:hypothetical protein